MTTVELLIRKEILADMIRDLLSDGPPSANDAQLVRDLAFGIRSIKSRLAHGAP